MAEKDKVFQKYIDVFETITVPVTIVDLENRTVMYNREFCKIFGYTKNELVGEKPPFSYWAEEDLENIQKAYNEEIVEGKTDLGWDMIFMAKDGRRIPVTTSTTKLTDDKGKLIGRAGFFIDIGSRIKVEEEIKQIITEWETTFNAVDDLICVSDKDYKIIRVNNAFAQAFKKNPKELVGKKCYELVHGTKDPLEGCPFIQVLKTKKSTVAEFFEPHLGRHLEVYITPIINKRGEITRFIQFIRDIGKRKQLEEAIHEEQYKYRKLLDTLQEGIWMIDKDSNTVFVNPRMAEILGYTLDEMQGRHMSSFMNERGIEIYKEYLDRPQPGTREQHEFEFFRKGGSRIYVNLVASPVFDNQGNHVAALAAVTDITERKLAEIAVSESEERYRNTVDNSPIGIVIGTVEGKVVSINKTMGLISGYSEEEFKKIDPSVMYVDQEERKKIIEIFKRDGKVTNYSAKMKRKDSTSYDALLSVSRLQLKEGSLIQTICIDVTEERKIEKALRRAKEYAELLYAVIPSAIFTIDLNQYITTWNKKAEEITGYTAEEVIGKRCSIFTQKPCIEKCGLYAADTKKPVTAEECSIKTKDGQLRIISKNINVLKDEKGNIIGGVECFEDITERKKAEEELNEFQGLIKAVFENSYDGIIIIDMETKKFHYCNKMITQLLGYNKEEIYNLSLADIHPSVVLPDVLKQLEKLARKEIKISKELPMIRKDGSIFYVYITVVSVISGGKNYIAGFYRDITDRKMAQEAQKSSEEKFRTLVENINVGVYRNTTGPQGRFLQANPAIAKIFGYDSVEEFLNINVTDLYLDSEERMRFDEEISWTGQLKGKELRLKKKDGTPIWCAVTAKIQYDEKGNTRWIDGTMEDISERKNKEKEVRVLQNQLEFILGATKTGLDIVDADYNVRYVDPEWKKLYGDYKGKKCYEYFMDKKEACPGCGIKRALELKRIAIYEETLAKEGNRPTQVTTIPFQNEKGEWLVAEINVDITERKKKEEELRIAYDALKKAQRELIQSEKLSALGRFASAIAREVKNPLGIILSNAEFVESKLANADTDTRDAINKIKESVERGNSVIQSLLEFAKPSDLKLEKFKANELIHEALDLVKYKAKNIEIQTKFVEEDIYLEVDKKQMQQALIKILLNSIEAMPKGGQIDISIYKAIWPEVSLSDPACVIEVRDNGIGMSKEDLARTFEPFFSKKIDQKGTGLGLYIVKRIMDSHKGKVVIDSELGKGTTVKIILRISKK